MPYNDETEQAGRFWGDEDRAAFYCEGGLTWEQSHTVNARINAKISGDPSRDWINHLLSTQLNDKWPVESALSLCCGEGTHELELARRGIFDHCLALDVSEKVLQRARARASEAGVGNIEFRCEDVNALVLEPERYDVVFSRSALHHVTALERILDAIAVGLKDHGILVINEYVGASQFQYSDRQIEVCNAALRLLPEAYRRSVSWRRMERIGPQRQRNIGQWLRLLWLKLWNFTLLEALIRRIRNRSLRRSSGDYIKREIPRVEASEMSIDDPSEAIRSEEILPLVRERFDILDYRPYGGTLLHPVLDDITGNFSPDDPISMDLLRMLFRIEDTLMTCGDIGSDFVYLVGRPKG